MKAKIKPTSIYLFVFFILSASAWGQTQTDVYADIGGYKYLVTDACYDEDKAYKRVATKSPSIKRR